MLNLLKVEFYKLKTSKSFCFIMLINLLQIILVYSFSENFKFMTGKQSFAYIFNIQSGLFLNILLGIFASDYIVTEFSSGYIKNLISYGHKRISIFISKSISYYIGTVIISFIAPLVMIVTNIIRNGYGEVFTLSSIIFVLEQLCLLILIYIAIGSINVLISFASRNTTITISVVVAIDFLNRFFDIVAIRIPSLQWLYTKIIFAVPGNVMSSKARTSEILQAIAISLITLLITNFTGIYIFEKADIK